MGCIKPAIMKHILFNFILSFTFCLAYGQSITSVSPAHGWRKDDVTLQVEGHNTLFLGAGYLSMTLVSDVDGYVMHSLGAMVFSDEQFQVSFFIPPDATLGSYTLNIPTTNQGVLKKNNAFTVINIPKPGLLSISPNQAQNGQNLDITIVGTNTKFTQLAINSVGIVFSQSFIADFITVLDDTHLKASFSIPSNAQSGLYHFYVDTIGGIYLETYSSFTINGVELASVTPSFATQGDTLDLTITGTRTSFTRASDIAVEFYKGYGPVGPTLINGTAVTVLNDLTLKTTVAFPKNANLDYYYVTVYVDSESYIGNSYMFYVIDDGFPDPMGLDETNSLIRRLYPNPVHEKLYIETKQQLNSLTIIDITGKQTNLNLTEIKQDPTHLVVPIDKLGLRSGIYFIRLESDNGFDYQKFIIE